MFFLLIISRSIFEWLLDKLDCNGPLSIIAITPSQVSVQLHFSFERDYLQTNYLKIRWLTSTSLVPFKHLLITDYWNTNSLITNQRDTGCQSLGHWLRLATFSPTPKHWWNRWNWRSSQNKNKMYFELFFVHSNFVTIFWENWRILLKKCFKIKTHSQNKQIKHFMSILSSKKNFNPKTSKLLKICLKSYIID